MPMGDKDAEPVNETGVLDGMGTLLPMEMMVVADESS
jgi:hypothetical protein